MIRNALLTLSLIAGTHALAAPATTVDATCRAAANDRFDLGWRMSSESLKFSGQCLDATERRPVMIQTDDADTMVFANLLDGNHFWTARWHKSDVPTVKFVEIYFASTVAGTHPAHTEMRFQFPQGLELTSQVGNETKVLNDVTVSWESTFPAGASFDSFASILRNTAFVGRVLSLSNVVRENTNADGRIRQALEFPLKLSRAESRRLFEVALQTSNQLQITQFYRTLIRNCTTEPIKLIDQVLAEMRGTPQSQLYYWHARPSTDPVARPAREGLTQMGLIEPNALPVHLGEEVGLAEL